MLFGMEPACIPSCIQVGIQSCQGSLFRQLTVVQGLREAGARAAGKNPIWITDFFKNSPY
jgi:hypothetical protein